MSDLSPSTKLLKKLGLNIPVPNREPTSEEQVQYEKKANKAEENDPIWKKAVTGGLGAIVGATKGMIGIDPEKDESGNWKSDIGSQVNKLTQLGSAAEGVLKSGLPFLAMTKGKPAFHGTDKVFEHIDPTKFDRSDTLGHMFHAAETPTYADTYASGSMKHGSNYNRRENIIPVHAEAKNVLDLVNPNIDDLSQTLASISPYKREELIQNFKRDKKFGYNPTNTLASGIQREMEKPDVLEKTPFDAIKYNDAMEPTYAIPHTTRITTPAGVKLNEPGKPIKIIKSERSAGPATSEIVPNPGGFNLVDTGKDYTADQIDKMHEIGQITRQEKNQLFKTNLIKPKYETYSDYQKSQYPISKTGKVGLSKSEQDALNKSKLSDIGGDVTTSTKKYTHKEIDTMQQSGVISKSEALYLKNKYPESEADKSYDFGSSFGHLTKKEAGHFLGAGEMSWSLYNKVVR